MSLKGGKLFCLDGNSEIKKVIKPQGKSLKIGGDFTCDYIDNENAIRNRRGIYFEIISDAFGNAIVVNHSKAKPIRVNDITVANKQRLRNNSIIKVFDKEYKWEFQYSNKRKSNQDESAKKMASDLVKSTSFEIEKDIPSKIQRLTVQGLVPFNMKPSVEIEEIVTEDKKIEEDSKKDNSDVSIQNDDTKKEKTLISTSNEGAKLLSLDNSSASDKENNVPHSPLQCRRSEILHTSFTPDKLDKSRPRMGEITPLSRSSSTSFYSTPKSIEYGDKQEHDKSLNMFNFSTPLSNRSMHCFDLIVTPKARLQTSLRKGSVTLLKSAIKNSAKKAMKTRNLSFHFSNSQTPDRKKIKQREALQNLRVSLSGRISRPPPKEDDNNDDDAIPTENAVKQEEISLQLEEKTIEQITLNSSCSIIEIDDSSNSDVIEISSPEDNSKTLQISKKSLENTVNVAKNQQSLEISRNTPIIKSVNISQHKQESKLNISSACKSFIAKSTPSSSFKINSSISKTNISDIKSKAPISIATKQTSSAQKQRQVQTESKVTKQKFYTASSSMSKQAHVKRLLTSPSYSNSSATSSLKRRLDYAAGLRKNSSKNLTLVPLSKKLTPVNLKSDPIKLPNLSKSFIEKSKNFNNLAEVAKLHSSLLRSGGKHNLNGNKSTTTFIEQSFHKNEDNITIESVLEEDENEEQKVCQTIKCNNNKSDENTSRSGEVYEDESKNISRIVLDKNKSVTELKQQEQKQCLNNLNSNDIQNLEGSMKKSVEEPKQKLNETYEKMDEEDKNDQIEHIHGEDKINATQNFKKPLSETFEKSAEEVKEKLNETFEKMDEEGKSNQTEDKIDTTQNFENPLSQTFEKSIENIFDETFEKMSKNVQNVQENINTTQSLDKTFEFSIDKEHGIVGETFEKRMKNIEKEDVKSKLEKLNEAKEKLNETFEKIDEENKNDQTEHIHEEDKVNTTQNFDKSLSETFEKSAEEAKEKLNETFEKIDEENKNDQTEHIHEEDKIDTTQNFEKSSSEIFEKSIEEAKEKLNETFEKMDEEGRDDRIEHVNEEDKINTTQNFEKPLSQTFEKSKEDIFDETFEKMDKNVQNAQVEEGNINTTQNLVKTFKDSIEKEHGKVDETFEKRNKNNEKEEIEDQLEELYEKQKSLQETKPAPEIIGGLSITRTNENANCSCAENVGNQLFLDQAEVNKSEEEATINMNKVFNEDDDNKTKHEKIDLYKNEKLNKNISVTEADDNDQVNKSLAEKKSIAVSNESEIHKTPSRFSVCTNSFNSTPIPASFNYPDEDIDTIFKTPSAKMLMIIPTPKSTNIVQKMETFNQSVPKVYDIHEDLKQLQGISGTSEFLDAIVDEEIEMTFEKNKITKEENDDALSVTAIEPLNVNKEIVVFKNTNTSTLCPLHESAMSVENLPGKESNESFLNKDPLCLNETLSNISFSKQEKDPIPLNETNLREIDNTKFHSSSASFADMSGIAMLSEADESNFSELIYNDDSRENDKTFRDSKTPKLIENKIVEKSNTNLEQNVEEIVERNTTETENKHFESILESKNENHCSTNMSSTGIFTKAKSLSPQKDNKNQTKKSRASYNTVSDAQSSNIHIDIIKLQQEINKIFKNTTNKIDIIDNTMTEAIVSITNKEISQTELSIKIENTQNTNTTSNTDKNEQDVIEENSNGGINESVKEEAMETDENALLSNETLKKEMCTRDTETKNTEEIQQFHHKPIKEEICNEYYINIDEMPHEHNSSESSIIFEENMSSLMPMVVVPTKYGKEFHNEEVPKDIFYDVNEIEKQRAQQGIADLLLTQNGNGKKPKRGRPSKSASKATESFKQDVDEMNNMNDGITTKSLAEELKTETPKAKVFPTTVDSSTKKSRGRPRRNTNVEESNASLTIAKASDNNALEIGLVKNKTDGTESKIHNEEVYYDVNEAENEKNQQRISNLFFTPNSSEKKPKRGRPSKSASKATESFKLDDVEMNNVNGETATKSSAELIQSTPVQQDNDVAKLNTETPKANVLSTTIDSSIKKPRGRPRKNTNVKESNASLAVVNIVGGSVLEIGLVKNTADGTESKIRNEEIFYDVNEAENQKIQQGIDDLFLTPDTIGKKPILRRPSKSASKATKPFKLDNVEMNNVNEETATKSSAELIQSIPAQQDNDVAKLNTETPKTNVLSTTIDSSIKKPRGRPRRNTNVKESNASLAVVNIVGGSVVEIGLVKNTTDGTESKIRNEEIFYDVNEAENQKIQQGIDDLLLTPATIVKTPISRRPSKSASKATESFKLDDVEMNNVNGETATKSSAELIQSTPVQQDNDVAKLNTETPKANVLSTTIDSSIKKPRGRPRKNTNVKESNASLAVVNIVGGSVLEIGLVKNTADGTESKIRNEEIFYDVNEAENQKIQQGIDDLFLTPDTIGKKLIRRRPSKSASKATESFKQDDVEMNNVNGEIATKSSSESIQSIPVQPDNDVAKLNTETPKANVLSTTIDSSIKKSRGRPRRNTNVEKSNTSLTVAKVLEKSVNKAENRKVQQGIDDLFLTPDTIGRNLKRRRLLRSASKATETFKEDDVEMTAKSVTEAPQSTSMQQNEALESNIHGEVINSSINTVKTSELNGTKLDKEELVPMLFCYEVNQEITSSESNVFLTPGNSTVKRTRRRIQKFSAIVEGNSENNLVSTLSVQEKLKTGIKLEITAAEKEIQTTTKDVENFNKSQIIQNVLENDKVLMPPDDEFLTLSSTKCVPIETVITNLVNKVDESKQSTPVLTITDETEVAIDDIFLTPAGPSKKKVHRRRPNNFSKVEISKNSIAASHENEFSMVDFNDFLMPLRKSLASNIQKDLRSEQLNSTSIFPTETETTSRATRVTRATRNAAKIARGTGQLQKEILARNENLKIIDHDGAPQNNDITDLSVNLTLSPRSTRSTRQKKRQQNINNVEDTLTNFGQDSLQFSEMPNESKMSTRIENFEITTSAKKLQEKNISKQQSIKTVSETQESLEKIDIELLNSVAISKNDDNKDAVKETITARKGRKRKQKLNDNICNKSTEAVMMASKAKNTKKILQNQEAVLSESENDNINETKVCNKAREINNEKALTQNNETTTDSKCQINVKKCGKNINLEEKLTEIIENLATTEQDKKCRQNKDQENKTEIKLDTKASSQRGRNKPQKQDESKEVQNEKEIKLGEVTIVENESEKDNHISEENNETKVNKTASRRRGRNMQQKQGKSTELQNEKEIKSGEVTIAENESEKINHISEENNETKVNKTASRRRGRNIQQKQVESTEVQSKKEIISEEVTIAENESEKINQISEENTDTKVDKAVTGRRGRNTKQKQVESTELQNEKEIKSQEVTIAENEYEKINQVSEKNIETQVSKTTSRRRGRNVKLTEVQNEKQINSGEVTVVENESEKINCLSEENIETQVGKTTSRRRARNVKLTEVKNGKEIKSEEVAIAENESEKINQISEENTDTKVDKAVTGRRGRNTKQKQVESTELQNEKEIKSQEVTIAENESEKINCLSEENIETQVGKTTSRSRGRNKLQNQSESIEVHNEEEVKLETDLVDNEETTSETKVKQSRNTRKQILESIDNKKDAEDDQETYFEDQIVVTKQSGDKETSSQSVKSKASQKTAVVTSKRSTRKQTPKSEIKDNYEGADKKKNVDEIENEEKSKNKTTNGTDSLNEIGVKLDPNNETEIVKSNKNIEEQQNNLKEVITGKRNVRRQKTLAVENVIEKENETKINEQRRRGKKRNQEETVGTRDVKKGKLLEDEEKLGDETEENTKEVSITKNKETKDTNNEVAKHLPSTRRKRNIDETMTNNANSTSSEPEIKRSTRRRK